MKERRIAAARGRCKGDWFGSEHTQILEIGGNQFSHTITHVAKDNYIVEIYRDDTVKIKQEALRYAEGSTD